MAGIIKKGFFKEQLTGRDRFRRVMQFQSVDRIPHFEFGYWDEVYGVWHKQGLPEYIKDEKAANEYFGFDRFELCPLNNGHLTGLNWLIPQFEERILEEDEKHKTIIDKQGVKCVIKRDGTSSIPYFIDFPLKNKEDWEQLKERLNPDDPRRVPENWDELVSEYAKRDYILGVHIGSLLGFIRNLMGFENTAMAFYDMPDLMDEIIEHMCQFNIKLIEKVLTDVDVDYANGWEDIAFKSGPMISPNMFREFLFPRFVRIAKVLQKHGVHVIFTDCDGNILPIADQWIEAGFTCQFPMEVGSGTDPAILRKEYGDKVLMIGGVNKHMLIKGKEAIDAELRRLEPFVEQGGYIPHVDHRCPPDVTLENYLYYLEQKKKILGF